MMTVCLGGGTPPRQRSGGAGIRSKGTGTQHGPKSNSRVTGLKFPRPGMAPCRSTSIPVDALQRQPDVPLCTLTRSQHLSMQQRCSAGKGRGKC